MAKSAKPDLFGDEKTVETGDFASMLERSLKPQRLSTGDTLRGEILSIGKESSFIATGTPVDGVIPTIELLDEEKQIKFKVGDIIEVKVVRVREGEIFLRKVGSMATAQDMENLEDAFDMEIPVEGKVVEVVKGGLRVDVMGKRAFCPISQIDLRRVEDAQEFVGKKFDFIVTQFENGGRNVVVSRRRVLEQQRFESEGAFLENKKPGDIMRGKITRLERFGAFVELQHGIEALIPISELAWSRVSHPSEIVQPGQEVDVALIRATEEDGRLRISVSLKGAGGESDPWTRVAQDFPVGTVLEGEVERKEHYGLFVRLSPSIVGLLPRSKWRDLVDGQQLYENRRKGERIQVQVAEISMGDHRITLAPPDDATHAVWRAHQAANAGKITTSGFGQLGDLLKGVQTKK